MMIEVIGEAATYELLAEECIELAHAALKMARIKRKENYTPLPEEKVKAAILEEWVDVNICADDLDLPLNLGIYDEKAERFKRRCAHG